MLFMMSSIIVIFSNISWMFRLSEFISGVATGLTLPLIHLYSSEVFTSKRSSKSIKLILILLMYFYYRRIKISLFITFIEMVGELISALICIFLTVEVISLKFIFALF